MNNFNFHHCQKIIGYAGSGKDTSYEVYWKRQGFQRLAFADALKEVASELGRVPLRYFYDVQMKDRPCLELPAGQTDQTPRDYLLKVARESV